MSASAGADDPLLASGDAARLRAGRVVLAGTALVAAVVLATGCPPHAVFLSDTFLLFDAGWRWVHGQAPHADYFNAFGPLTPAFFGLATRALGATTSVYGLARAGMAALVGGVAWRGFRARLAPAPAAFATLFAILAAAAPRHLDHDFRIPSGAMIYNRLGMTLLGVLLVLVLVPPPGEEDPGDERLAGGILGLLFALKPNFLVAGGLGMAAALALRLRRRAPLPLVAWGQGFVLALAAVWAITGASPVAIAGDYLAVAALHPPGGLVGKALRQAYQEAFPLGVLVLGGWLAGASRAETPRAPGLLAAAAATAAGFVAAAGNSQVGSVSTLAIAAWILVACGGGPRDASERIRVRASIGVAVVLGLRTALPDALALGYATLARVPGVPLRVEYPIGAGPLAGLPVLPRAREPAGLAAARDEIERHAAANPGKPASDLARPAALLVADGLELLRREGAAGARVFSLDVDNPFPFALAAPPPSGGALFWRGGYVQVAASCPPYEATFRDVEVLMVPRRPHPANAARLLREAYGPELDRDFEPVAESRFWTLHRRRSR